MRESVGEKLGCARERGVLLSIVLTCVISNIDIQRVGIIILSRWLSLSILLCGLSEKRGKNVYKISIQCTGNYWLFIVLPSGRGR